MTFSNPVTNAVLLNLPLERAAELRTWARNHARIFDLRLHRAASCTFFYTWRYYISRKSMTKEEWAVDLYEFFKAKHREEDNCKCVVEIAVAATKRAERN